MTPRSNAGRATPGMLFRDRTIEISNSRPNENFLILKYKILSLEDFIYFWKKALQFYVTVLAYILSILLLYVF